MDYEVPFPGAAAPFSEEDDEDESSDEDEGPHPHGARVTDVLQMDLTALRRSSQSAVNDQEPARSAQRRRIR